MEKFIENTKKLMEENSITQKELSKITHISEASLSRYLNGTLEPRYDILLNIAKAFDVDVNFLLGKENIENKINYFDNLYSLVTRSRTKLTEEEKYRIIKCLLEKEGDKNDL